MGRRIIVGAWDCKYCNAKAVSGELRECPHCGNPRGEGVQFYLPGGEKQVVPEEVAEKINRNPDWLCPYCGTYNSDSISSCESCGNKRSEKDINYFEHHEELEKKKDILENGDISKSDYIPKIDESEEISQDDGLEETDCSEFYEEPEETESKVKKVFSNIFSSICNVVEFVKDNVSFEMIFVFFTIFLIGLGIYFIATPRVENMVVERVLWVHNVEIEEQRTVNESGWSLPAGARLQRTADELYDIVDVFDHYETKTRTVPKRVFAGYETKTKEVPVEVFDHYEPVVRGYKDLGNGYFEEIVEDVMITRTEYRTETYQEEVYKTVYVEEEYQEKVYRKEEVYKTKYYYEIDKWFYNRSVQASGASKETYWPEEKLSKKERVSNREATYTIRVIDEDGEIDNIKLEYDRWVTIEVDSVVKVKKWLWGSKIVFEE